MGDDDITHTGSNWCLQRTGKILMTLRYPSALLILKHSIELYACFFVSLLDRPSEV